MSQFEIHEFLLANSPKSYCCRDIAYLLKLTKGSVTTNLSKLVDRGQVRYDEVYVRHPKGNYLTRLYHCDMNRVCVIMGVRKKPARSQTNQKMSYKTQVQSNNSSNKHRIY